MKKKKLSIIFTTYNNEQTILTTLDSICKIENLSYEILIADDNSSDDTVKLIKKYFKNKTIDYSLIESKENLKYPGVYLNRMLDKSCGEYIHFIDGDDFVDYTIYNSLLAKEEDNDSDIKEFGYITVENNVLNSRRSVKQNIVDDYPYEKVKKINNDFPVYTYNYWTKLIKTQFIKENKVSFVEGESAQDKKFILNLFSFKPKYEIYKDIGYFYVIGNSNSLSANIKKKKILDEIKGLELEEKLNIYSKGRRKKSLEYLLNMTMFLKDDFDEELLNIFQKNYNFFDAAYSMDTLNLKYYMQTLKKYFFKFLKERNLELVNELLSFHKDIVKFLRVPDHKVFNSMSKNYQQICQVYLYYNLYKIENNQDVRIKLLNKVKLELKYLKVRNFFENYADKTVDYDFLLKIIEIYEEFYPLSDFGKQERLPLRINKKDQYIEYFKLYNKKYKYKYSLIMTSYNREETIFKSIDSFIKANYDNSELIIVDNNSELELVKKIAKYCEGIENIKLIFNKENDYCGARNHGIKISQGNFIAFIDDDDLIVPNYFNVLDKYLKSNKFDALRFNEVYVDNSYNIIKDVHFNNAYYTQEENLCQKNLNHVLAKYREKLPTSHLVVMNKRLLNENQFLEKVIFEDNSFYNEITLTINNLLLINEALYLRNKEIDSITTKERTQEYQERLFYDTNTILLDMINQNKLIAKENSMFLKLNNYSLKWYKSHCGWTFSSAFNEEKDIFKNKFEMFIKNQKLEDKNLILYNNSNEESLEKKYSNYKKEY